jgi:hypothetical protein
MTPPVVESKGSSMRFTIPPAAYSIVENHGRLFNVIQIPGADENPGKTVIDVFATDGRLLCSREFDHPFQIRCDDAAGHLYAIDYQDFPSVTRYRVATRPSGG